MNKKGDIWISAVIYIAIGIAILTLVLSAGLPLIDKIKDRNVFLQTKNVMNELDNTVREVNREGFGSRRTPVIKIDKGEFRIISDDGNDGTDTDNKIIWTMNTKTMFSEPGYTVKEGNLNIITEQLPTKDYSITITLDYNNIIKLDSDLRTLSGNYNLIISKENDGSVKITSQ